MALSLDTVTFTVRDLDACVHFFCDLLRFCKGRVMDYPHLKTKVVYCESDMGQVCLIRDGSRQAPPVEAVPGELSRYGFNRCTFSCEDIAAERGRLQRLGVRFRSEVIAMPDGRKVAFFAGPEGMEFELVEYGPLAFETLAGRETLAAV